MCCDEMDDDLIRGVDRLTIGRGAPVGRDEGASTRVNASTDPESRRDESRVGRDPFRGEDKVSPPVPVPYKTHQLWLCSPVGVFKTF